MQPGKREDAAGLVENEMQMSVVPPPPSVITAEAPPPYVCSSGQLVILNPHDKQTVYANQPVFTTPGNAYVTRPADHMIMSVLSCVFCNGFFCTGLIALICSILSRSAADVNQMELAKNRGKHARNLSIAAIIGTVVCVSLFLAFIIEFVIMEEHHLNRLMAGYKAYYNHIEGYPRYPERGNGWSP